MSDEVSVTITRQANYRFMLDFGPEIAKTVADEPAPVGEGAGPSPSQLLAAAVGSCLSASLLFAHGKFKEDPVVSQFEIMAFGALPAVRGSVALAKQP